MLNNQKKMLGYLESLVRILERVREAEIELTDQKESIETLSVSIRDRELLVPVVGAFSAGKSSLLNAIIGSSILPMDIKPETAIPTELRYDSQENLEAITVDGRTEICTLDKLSELHANAEKYRLLRLYMNRPVLKGIAPLVLVDMPGFNSPLDAHDRAISYYIGQGAHYLFVVSVEEGALQTQILRNIDEVVQMERSFGVCVNKADLKPAADVNNICAYISNQLEDEGFSAKVFPVSKNDISSVHEMLSGINPEQLFESIFQVDLVERNVTLEHSLSTAIEGFKGDKQANEEKVAEIENSLRALEAEREQQMQAANAKGIEPAVKEVLRSVRNRLAGVEENLARAALRSQDEMMRMVTSEVRSGLTLGLKRVTDNMSAHMVNEFSQHVSSSLRPELSLSSSSWTEPLLKTLQSQLLPSLMSSLGQEGTGAAAGGIAEWLSNMRAATPHPIVQVALTVLPMLVGPLFDRINQAQQLEQAKEAIRSQVLPEIESGLHAEVSAFLLKSQQEIVQAVAAAFDQQISAQKDILEKIIQQADSGNLETRINILESALSEVRALAASMSLA